MSIISNLNEVAQILKSMDYIYILTHSFPDGDALGSAFVLCRALQKIGKRVRIKFDHDIPRKFNFLNDYIDHDNFKPPDYIISVDLATDSLLDDGLQRYASRIDMCIDHHFSNTKYACLNYIDSTASANCEIIYDLLNIMGIELDKEMAQGLYLGITGDTGCFRYSNTTAKTHYIAAKLMEHDIKFSEINDKFFSLKSKKILDIERILYQNMTYFADNKIAMSYVTYKNITDLGIDEHECDGIASIPIRIEGVQVGAVFRQKSTGEYKVSIRTIEGINANAIASMFDGGGHYKAAGFNLPNEPVENLLKLVSDKIIEHMNW